MTKDWVQGVGHSPVCQILLQIVVRVVITSSPPAWTSSGEMLLTPAVVRNQSSMLLLKRKALVSLSYRFLMTRISLVLILYFMVAHKAACQTLSVQYDFSMTLLG